VNVYIGRVPNGLVPDQASGEEGMSSLERFVRARGPLFAGGSYGKRSANIQMGAGAAICATGSVLLFLPLAGVDWHVMFGAIGPMTAGIVNLAVGFVMKKRLASTRSISVPLSDEAKSVIVQLNRKYLRSRGSWSWDEAAYRGQWGHHPHAIRRQHGFSQLFDTPRLSRQVLDKLERAAYQYNRITALLITSASHPAISRVASKSGDACDQAMADVLHQAGWLSRYPEGADAAANRLDVSISEMMELGDRIQGLATSEPTFTERLAARSEMHEVLEELRMEQAARSELIQKTEG
jgi:hypothetical protein